MKTELHSIFLRISISYHSRLKHISFDKVALHQDEINNLTDLTLHDRLNVEFDSMEKNLILSTPEYRTVPFPLNLSPAYVSLCCDNVDINCTEDLHMHAYLIKCSTYFKRNFL